MANVVTPFRSKVTLSGEPTEDGLMWNAREEDDDWDEDDDEEEDDEDGKVGDYDEDEDDEAY